MHICGEIKTEDNSILFWGFHGCEIVIFFSTQLKETFVGLYYMVNAGIGSRTRRDWS